MYYFSEHPIQIYDLFKDGKPVVVTDITRALKLTTFFNDRSLILYEYVVKESDRPDIIAEKYYNDSTLDWVLFLTNKIIDPYFQWPMTQTELESYVRQKYGSIPAAQATNHHYEWIIEKSRTITGVDGEQLIKPERIIIVDQLTYNSKLPDERRAVDAYQNEINLNEKRRNIRILDKAFLPYITRTMDGIFE
jgi:hypothetical protein